MGGSFSSPPVLHTENILAQKGNNFFSYRGIFVIRSQVKVPAAKCCDRGCRALESNFRAASRFVDLSIYPHFVTINTGKRKVLDNREKQHRWYIKWRTSFCKSSESAKLSKSPSCSSLSIISSGVMRFVSFHKLFTVDVFTLSWEDKSVKTDIQIKLLLLWNLSNPTQHPKFWSGPSVQNNPQGRQERIVFE